MKAPYYAERGLAVAGGGDVEDGPLAWVRFFDMVAAAVARKNGLHSEPRLFALFAGHCFCTHVFTLALVSECYCTHLSRGNSSQTQAGLGEGPWVRGWWRVGVH